MSRQFREVFQQNSSLSRFVYFHMHKALQNLLEWLSSESTPVKQLTLVHPGTDCQEVILGALLSRPQRYCLEFFHGNFRGTSVSDTAVKLLGSFGSLTSCRLQAFSDSQIDLAPLHALSHLR